MTGTFNLIPFLFVIAIIVATVWLGLYATRMSQTASDFFVAGRSVSVFWNASAISGEYLSAASFMGIAGIVMKNGYDGLWYPVGYATGYLFLLLFIAGPLRRFGAYTIPDFAEGRFDSPLFRRIAVMFVLFIGFFYTMPQMKAAGVTMNTILGWPYWAGIVAVGGIITFNVALGGMKGITFVQAFQYWVKAFAISIPVFVLMAIYGGYSGTLAHQAQNPTAVPQVAKDTPLKFKGKASAPANVLQMPANKVVDLRFPDDAKIERVTPQVLAPDGKTVLKGPKLAVVEPVTAVIKAGSYVPNAQNNKKWSEPFGTLTGKYNHPLLYTYSLIIALVCGTAGLPHILVRFYTNPDGRAAKRTTLWVMVLIGVFYAFTPIWGTLGRAFLPALYANNSTDVAVLKLPLALENKLLGQILSGIVSAGAFAAFMSTFSGLLVSMSGALAHDVYGKILRPNAPPEARLKAFKFAAVLFGVISIGLGLLVESFDIAMLVGWAFAIAAASYFPLLLLGAWWRGLTMQGAAAGMLTGGLLSLGAIVTFMLLDKKILTFAVPDIVKSLMEQPAVWGVPLALGTMFVVSLVTQKSVPKDINLKMLRLHAPEEMGLSKNYIEH